MIIKYRPAKQYLNDLRTIAGFSDAAIAEEVGICRTTIFRLRIGRHNKTSDEIGSKIANLHAKVFEKRKDCSS